MSGVNIGEVWWWPRAVPPMAPRVITSPHPAASSIHRYHRSIHDVGGVGVGSWSYEDEMIRHAVRLTISRQQCKAARAWLGWTQIELAKAAKISAATIADFERGARQIAESTNVALIRAFDANGVTFPDGGVILKPKPG